MIMESWGKSWQEAMRAHFQGNTIVPWLQTGGLWSFIFLAIHEYGHALLCLPSSATIYYL